MALIIGKNGKKEWSKLNKYNFDFNGDYYELCMNGKVLSNCGKTDPYGFDVNGIHKETKKRIDTNHFDRDGYYWKRDVETKSFRRTKSKINGRHFNRDGIYCLVKEDGQIVPTGNTRDPEGYDIRGLDINGFNRKGIHYKTRITVNENGFNKDGFYCKENENGEYVLTGSKYNPRGFKIDKTYMETGKKYDDRKFDFDGINVVTEDKLDLRGFDCDGICVLNENSIFDKNGFKADKTYGETGELYDEDGYNCYGLDKNGVDRKGNMPDEVKILKAFLEKNLLMYDILKLDKSYLYRKTGISEYKKKYGKTNKDIYRFVNNIAFEKCPEIVQRVYEERYANNPEYDESKIKGEADAFKKRLLEESDLFKL